MFFKAYLYSERASTTALLFTSAMLVFVKNKLQTGSELGAPWLTVMAHLGVGMKEQILAAGSTETPLKFTNTF